MAPAASERRSFIVTDQHHADLLALVECAQRAFEDAPIRPPAGEEPARRVFELLLGADLEPTPVRGSESLLPACAHLDEAVSTAQTHGGSLAELAGAIDLVTDRTAWVRRQGPERSTSEFARGHANAVLARASGSDGDALLGVSLMAPHVRYPDHRHPPEEVYVVLSPGEWRNDRAPWFEPGVGGIVHNSPGIVHAMRSEAAPLLAIWLHLDVDVAR